MHSQNHAGHGAAAQQLIDSKNLINTAKGWDIRIFRDEHLARRFLCQLCHNVCRDAHELSCSSAHLFCRKCIEEYSAASQTTTCPLCHELNVSHQASRFVTRHINELQTYCPRSKLVCSKLMQHARFNNNTLFCTFQGSLQSLAEHVQHQCIFNVIACPFHLIGCPTNKLYRYELQQHIEAAQNKHISLSLQKIQRLQHSLKQREDSNEIYQEQLRALKTASRTKDRSIEQLSFENEALKVKHSSLVHEVGRLQEELKGARSRIESYSKAVHLLKANNSKLAEQVDDLSDRQQAAPQFLGHRGALRQPPGGDQSEVANQFNALLSLQRANQEQQSQAAQHNAASSGGSEAEENGLGILRNDGDEKQPNSTDVVCAFLKEHSEIVAKLKNSNQIMYANIITDDKYAAQFLKKMLQSGNENYRTEISGIVQRLQT